MTHHTMKELPLVFDCRGEDLIGIVHRPAVPCEVGVLVIVAGGPQYRAGVGRGMVSLARALASQGVAVLRFDYRGLGDSSGKFLGFNHIGEDIQAAVDAFRQAVPEVKRVVIWGGCDAASAAMIHGWKIDGVTSLVLGNPWISTEEIRAAVMRKHYLKRISEVQFWQKVIRFEYNLFDYASAGLRKISGRLRAIRGRIVDTRAAGTGARNTAATGAESAARPTDRMLTGLRQFNGPVLFLMSGRSLVSSEFDELLNSNAGWRSVYERPNCKRIDLPDADQTFSDADSRERVNQAILDWVVTLRAN